MSSELDEEALIKMNTIPQDITPAKDNKKQSFAMSTRDDQEAFSSLNVTIHPVIQSHTLTCGDQDNTWDTPSGANKVLEVKAGEKMEILIKSDTSNDGDGKSFSKEDFEEELGITDEPGRTEFVTNVTTNTAQDAKLNVGVTGKDSILVPSSPSGGFGTITHLTPQVATGMAVPIVSTPFQGSMASGGLTGNPATILPPNAPPTPAGNVSQIGITPNPTGATSLGPTIAGNPIGNTIARSLPVTGTTGHYQNQANVYVHPTSLYPTWKRFASRVTANTSSNAKYPLDSYSFIALNGHQKGQAWTKKRFKFFLFGLLPCGFQMLFLGLLLYSQMNELRGTIGETDNPDQDIPGAFFATFLPANATLIVRWAQVTAMTAYLIFPDSSLQDVVRAIQLFPQGRSDGVGYLRLSCVLRLIQGTFAMIVTLLLVLTSETVVDIILNFTAVNFISGLDDDAFTLAISGEFSPGLKVEAERIAGTDLPPCAYKNEDSRWKCYKCVTGCVYLFIFGMIIFVYYSQNSDRVWVTRLLRVQFQDSTGLNAYSGCFGINTDSSSVEFSRRTYHSFDTGILNTSFGYCRDDRQWILFKGNTTNPCNASNDAKLLLARSSKTDTFDISTSFDEGWVSGSNTPLDLYFFDGGNESEIRDHCDSVLDDGNCDIVLNELGYDYDGGDCCAATCTKFNCGRGGLTSVFGNFDVSGDGYENCTDPNMFPITIHLNSMTSSRDPKITGWNDYCGPDYQTRPWGFDENAYNEWMQVVPVSPYFALDCNGKNVMTAFIDDSMVNKSQRVMVEDGATCTLTVRNTTTDNDIYTDNPIWFVDYALFHEKVNGNEEARVEIFTNSSSFVEAVNFTRIPDCYFQKLEGYVDHKSLYIAPGSSSAKKSIDWLLEDEEPKSQCEDSNFMERYALVSMNFAMNSTQEFINREEQCRWPSISCSEGFVRSIQMRDGGLEGSIPSELRLLSSLEELQLSCDQIPSLLDMVFPETFTSIDLGESSNVCEGFPLPIFKLTSLRTLNSKGNLFQRLPADIRNLSNLEDLNLAENQIAELPSEIVNLTQLTKLNLAENQIVEVPSEIWILSQLTDLNLYGNEIVELPSEIGNLSQLRNLRLGRNQLVELPSEIGNLSQLRDLNLYSNQLVELPSDIGNLSLLTELNLGDNEIVELPSEIWNLSQLTDLTLGGNLLVELPSEIGNLSQLTELNLGSSQIVELPSEIWNLPQLTELHLDHNQLVELPSEIGNLSQLRDLNLYSNQLVELPSEIGNILQLTNLRLAWNQIVVLPTEIGNLSQLRNLGLGGNQIVEVPSEILILSQLTELHLSSSQIVELPSEIGNLSQLRNLRLGYNQIAELPSEIGNLSLLMDLWLVGNEIVELPSEIGNLSQLRNLGLGGNQLVELPSEIGNLSQLTDLWLGVNELAELPSEIGNLSSLEFLDLLLNQISELPSEIGFLTNLKYLEAGSNIITSIPSEIVLLTNLEILGLGDNQITSLPEEIVNLSNLNTLYLYGNDFNFTCDKLPEWLSEFCINTDCHLDGYFEPSCFSSSESVELYFDDEVLEKMDDDYLSSILEAFLSSDESSENNLTFFNDTDDV